MELVIRKAKKEDLESIFKVEKRSYPPELQAPHKTIKERFETFGIVVAELNKEIVGFYTCIPVFLDWSNMPKVIGSLKQNRNPHYKNWFEKYKKEKEFNTLYITSTAVSSIHQNKGIGKKLVENSLKLAKKNNLKYRASVLRIPGFAKFKKTGKNINEYLDKIKSKKIINKNLSLYLSLGFKLGQPVKNYETDRTSSNYGIFAFKKLS